MAAESSQYRPLLAKPARVPALAAIGLAITALTVMSIRYADQDMPGRVDRFLDALIRDHFPAEPAMQALAGLGNPAPAAVLVLTVAAAAAAAQRWSGALLAIIGTSAAVALTELFLKPLIGRLRFGHLTFPSGHTTAVGAVAVAAVILIGGARWPRSRTLRVVGCLGAITLAAGVALSLVALRIHYATDTLAGSCVAVVTVLAVAFILDLLHPRHSLKRGATEGPGGGVRKDS
jgi:membrane-associated phospholipid phosphatase